MLFAFVNAAYLYSGATSKAARHIRPHDWHRHSQRDRGRRPRKSDHPQLRPWRSLLIAGPIMIASQARSRAHRHRDARCQQRRLCPLRHDQCHNVPAVPGNLLSRITSLTAPPCEVQKHSAPLVAAVAGFRATMLIGAIPIAAAVIPLTWHHRGTATTPANDRSHLPAR